MKWNEATVPEQRMTSVVPVLAAVALALAVAAAVSCCTTGKQRDLHRTRRAKQSPKKKEAVNNRSRPHTHGPPRCALSQLFLRTFNMEFGLVNTDIG